MLEAWEKAEKIWYQYIWEEIREPSNIVEYNINKEITKDASNVINANNDTTTWMATLIYGVNAPKLLEKTSVYRNTVIQWSSTLTFNNVLQRPDDSSWRIRSATIVKNYGNIDFTNKEVETYNTNWAQVYWYNWVVIPITWGYEITINCPYIYTGATNSTETRLYKWNGSASGTLIFSKVVTSVYWYTETFNYSFEAWDTIYVWNEFISNVSSPIEVTATTTINMTLV